MPSGAAPGKAQLVFEEEDLALWHSGSVAGSEVGSERGSAKNKNAGHGEGHLDGGESGEGESWGGMIFGQLLDRSPMKVLARSSFAS